jgi:hypothetical protein
MTRVPHSDQYSSWACPGFSLTKRRQGHRIAIMQIWPAGRVNRSVDTTQICSEKQRGSAENGVGIGDMLDQLGLAAGAGLRKSKYRQFSSLK